MEHCFRANCFLFVHFFFFFFFRGVPWPSHQLRSGVNKGGREVSFIIRRPLTQTASGLAPQLARTLVLLVKVDREICELVRLANSARREVNAPSRIYRKMKKKVSMSAIPQPSRLYIYTLPPPLTSSSSSLSSSSSSLVLLDL